MNSLEPILYPVTMPDASTSQVRMFRAHPENPENPEESPKPDRPLVIVWPGFGMGARYFDPLGKELASRGYNVAVGELRGQGNSDAVATRKHTWGYHHLASQDYPLSVQAAKEFFDLPANYPTVFLCHSLGGQLASLFFARPEARDLNVLGFMGVGAGTPYHSGYKGENLWKLRLGTPILQVVVNLIGYQPAGRFDITGYGRQPKHKMLEWIRYGRTNKLQNLLDQDLDYIAAQQEVDVPILLTSFVGDLDCPIPAAENLAATLPRAKVTVEQLPQKLGHNRWAREPEAAANRFDRWVSEVSAV